MTQTMKQRELMLFGIAPDSQACINCKHFYLHYIQDIVHKGYCTPTYIGHCVYPRLKSRKASDCCEHFQQRTLCNIEKQKGGRDV